MNSDYVCIYHIKLKKPCKYIRNYKRRKMERQTLKKVNQLKIKDMNKGKRYKHMKRKGERYRDTEIKEREVE